MSDKTGWKGRGQQLRDSHWARRDRVPSPGPAKENNYARESLDGYIGSGCRELKRKFRLTSFSLARVGHDQYYSGDPELNKRCLRIQCLVLV
jgi:hypothetical protein